MRSRYNIIAVLVFHCSLLIVNCSLSFAQWSTDPNVNLQVSSWGQYPVACTDGEGGVFIRWEQNSYTTDQYIQHVNKYGYVRWATPVEVYGTQNGTVFEGKICPDDSNGVIVLFTEWNVIGGDPQYFTHKRVRVNRLDSNGYKLWGKYGVRVSMRDTSQALREIVTDGQKGCIVAFLVAPDSLYVQRISSTGQRMWGEEGIFVHKLGTYGEITAVTDCNNGIILNYWESTTQTTRFQRRNGSGDTLWTKISATPYTLMKSDGYGGLLLSMNRYYYGEDRIIMNSMNSDGTFKWGDYGITVSDCVGENSHLSDIISDDSNNTILTWQKITSGIYPHVYTQKISSDGSSMWPDNFQVSLNPNYSAGCKITKSDSNGIIYIWTYGSGLSAQKINSNGNILWNIDDVEVSNHDLTASLNVISDLDYGAIAIWDEAPLNGIFAQQINKTGFLGTVVNIDENNINIPKNIILHQNYPNPFNMSTTIEYDIYNSGFVTLKIYNILGQEIKTLVENFQNESHYKINFNSTGLASGLYFYRLKLNNFSDTRKFLLIK